MYRAGKHFPQCDDSWSAVISVNCLPRFRLVMPQMSLVSHILGDAVAIALFSFAMLRKFVTSEEESCAVIVNEKQASSKDA